MAEENAGTEEVLDEGTPAPDPIPTPPVAEPPAPSSPWAEKLEAAFDDPNQRAAVDEFLRGEVQPYVTRLEQSTATDRNAKRLWDDFTENPNETFFSVAEELYGGDVAAKFKSAMTAIDESTTTEENPYNADLDITLDELPPAVRQVVEDHQSQKARENWDRLVEQVQTDNPDLKVRGDLFAPFVNAVDGDVDVAVEAYRDYVKTLQTEYGVTPEEAPDPASAAPATLGRETAVTTTPPVDTTPKTVDEAIDEMWNDMQSAKAPAVLPG